MALKENMWKEHYLVLRHMNLKELLNKKMLIQKLGYIHYNPVCAGICEIAENYHYSSARFYVDGKNDFGRLKHFSD